MEKITKRNYKEVMQRGGVFNEMWTKLMLAISYNDIDTAKELILKGENLNAQNNHGQTALMVAITHKRVEIIKMLIDAGVDLEIRDYLFGDNALSRMLRGKGKMYNNKFQKLKRIKLTEYKKLVLGLLYKGGCFMNESARRYCQQCYG